MFLITTADRRFWKKDGAVLFLGEWCKLYKEKSVWEKLDYKTLPYHWDDRDRLYGDFIKIGEIYEKYLQSLSLSLNRMHGTAHSVRYWRIVVGIWLRYFIEILYDRYLSVISAQQSGLATETWIADNGEMDWVPNDFEQFQKWLNEDSYNHFLYGELIKLNKKINYTVKSVEARTEQADRKKMSARQVLKYISTNLFSYVPSRLNRNVFISSYFSLKHQIGLQLKLGQVPYLASPSVQTVGALADKALRDKITLPQPADGFSAALNKLIPLQIPVNYIENYSPTRKAALRIFPRQPKLISTANAHVANDGFKFWAAEKIDGGTKLVIAQHGGHYGSGKWSSIEDHEIAISDHYASWGWADANQLKIVALPSGKLSKIRGKISPNPRGSILLVETSFPRYSYRMFSVPVAGQILDYIEEQRRFIKNLSSGSFQNLLVRLDSIDYGWHEADRWKDMMPELRMDEVNRPIFKSLKESRLCVCTYNATTYLETLSLNFPTVIFWHPRHCEIKKSAETFFGKLRNVGIFHDTPESAADFVNQVAEDPLAWWFQTDVQSARDSFARQFAASNSDLVREWKRFVIGLR